METKRNESSCNMPEEILEMDTDVKNVRNKARDITIARKLSSKRRQRHWKEHGNHHTWSIKDKMALLHGMQKYGFENMGEIVKMVGTKDQNEIRFFINNRRTALLRKLRQEEIKKSNVQKRALVELWSQTLNSEVLVRHRSNDCSGCIAEIFDHGAEKESHLMPENDKEPDISAIYSFFSKMISGIFPSELRPIDSMLVLSLVQNLRDIMTASGLEVERELYSKFQGGKGNTNFLTEQLPNTSGAKNETDPWEPYRYTDPEIIKLSKQYSRLVQYFNPLHVPPSLLHEETELLKHHMFDSA